MGCLEDSDVSGWGLLGTIWIVHFCLNVRLGLPLAFQARDSPWETGGGRVSPKGKPTYLVPNRVSEVFKEEGVLVARLCWGPGEPHSDSCCLTEGPAQPLTAQLGKRRPRGDLGDC